jgi:hypothetical protein
MLAGFDLTRARRGEGGGEVVGRWMSDRRVAGGKTFLLV